MDEGYVAQCTPGLQQRQTIFSSLGTNVLGEVMSYPRCRCRRRRCCHRRCCRRRCCRRRCCRRRCRRSRRRQFQVKVFVYQFKPG